MSRASLDKADIQKNKEDTKAHQNRVGLLSLQLARFSNFSEEECSRAYLAGVLHDAGKEECDQHILYTPQKYTEAQFSHIKTHTLLSFNIISKMSVWDMNDILSRANKKEGLNLALLNPDDTQVVSEIACAALLHHERLDGSGYPFGLRGDGISKNVRILSAADSFDAGTNNRPHQNEKPPLAVLREIIRGSGKLYDAQVVGSLCALNASLINNPQRPAPFSSPYTAQNKSAPK